ncbi:MAG TPA: OB-fold nucleic acid binding domain-containing protein, partial [Kofleriaceae bacterium]|nr:OB-fold nucleic acid binding domain-containing protein [Kofleriaceae bacterium]
IGAAIDAGAQAQRDRKSGQTSLFGLLGGPGAKADGAVGVPETYPTLDPWTDKERLALEKEALGFYISGHPLDRYRWEVARHASATTVEFAEGTRKPGPARIAGVVTAYRERPTRRGDGKLAFFQLEDTLGQLEVVVFPKTFEKVRPVLVGDEPLLCSGKVVDEGEQGRHAYKMLLEEAVPLSELRREKTTRIEIALCADSVTSAQIEALRGALESARGSCQAVVKLAIGDGTEAVIPLGDAYKVAPTDELLTRLERLFGTRVATCC